MPITATCRNCHRTFQSRVFHFSPNIVIQDLVLSGNTESCPHCGGIADMISGRFNYAAGVLTAFRAPGMTREKVAQVSEIVSDAVKGEISADEAVQRAANVHSSLGAFLRAAHERGITFDRVLAVILAIYTFWTQYSSDADVQAALEELHSQTEIARKQDERSEKLLLELQEQNSTLRELATKSVSPQPGRTQTNGTKNRYERRKAAAIERRTKRGRE